MNKLLLFYLFILCLCVHSIDFGIKARADYYGDLEPTTNYENLRSQLYISPSLSLDIQNNIDFYISLNLFYDPIADETLPRVENLLREGYIRYRNSFISLYLGQKIVNWGKVDFYSPINILNPIDLTVLSLDNIEESRLPTPMVDLIISPHYTTNVEIIYEPFLRPYYTPNEERNIVVDMFTMDLDTNFIHENPDYFEIMANSFFISINYWSYWFDILLSYSNFMDPYPDFDVSDITQVIEKKTFFSVYKIRGNGYTSYNRAQLFGIGLSTNIEEWGVDAEAGLKVTEDWEGTRFDIKNSEFVTNLQVNRTFFTDWFTQVNIIYRHIINYDVEPESNIHSTVLRSLNAEFQSTFLQPTKEAIYMALHIHKFFLHEKLYTGVNTGMGVPINPTDYYEDELFVSPRLSYTLNDLTKISTGIDLYLQGEAAGYIGRNKYKDNFYIKVTLEY